MKRLLIIGASGLLGSKAMEIAQKGYAIAVSGTYNKNPIPIMAEMTDVKDNNGIYRLVGGLKPDVILDAHALNSVDYCEEHKSEARQVNVEGTLNVVEAARSVGAKTILVSSDYIFDGKKELYGESDEYSPLNVLGQTKVEMEELANARTHNLLIIRASGLYGAKSSTGKQSFVQFIIDKLQKGQATDVLTDQYLSFTLVDDLVLGIFKLVEKGSSGTFNVATPIPINKYEFALKIAEEYGLDKNLLNPVDSSQINQAAKRPKKVKFNISKFTRETGFRPRDVAEGIKWIKES